MGATLPLFDDTRLDTDHAWYGACRDHFTRRPIRRALARIWTTLGEFIPEPPKQFVSEFRKDFPARSWELYVLALLARSGAKLVKSPREGPDFCATLPDGRRFWVECIVPGHGKGEDAVPLPPSSDGNGRRSGTAGPSARVALRYTNAITTKIAKVESYRAKGIVKPTEAVLVAVNQGAIDLSDLHDVEVPLLVRVLFGIGETVILVDPYAHTSRAHVPRMPSVRKHGGSDVPTQIFLTDASASIAGVLFARRSIFNLFPVRTRLAYLAHNPRAHVGFPLAALPLRGEVWVEQRLNHAGTLSQHGPLARRRRYPA